jgi:hypothetical protein
MREQWVGIEHGDEFAVTEDEDGYPAICISNRVWVGEESRWITASGADRDMERNVRALAAALVEMADAMADERR